MTTRLPVRTPWLALALAIPVMAARPGFELRPLADRLFQRLDALRHEQGTPAWERRAALDAAAATVAQRIADGHTDLERPIRAVLREHGVTDPFRAVPIVHRFRTGNDPLESALSLWDSYRPAREGLRDARIHAIGLARAVSGDGSYVLVGILVEDRQTWELRVEELERRTADGIKRLRADHGLPPLNDRAEIGAIARAHSEEMARLRYFEHTSPTGRDAGDRARRAGLRFLRVAENISRVEGVQDPVDTALSGWMSSYGHRANILDADFESSGIGIAVSEDGVIFFTQVFLQTAASGNRGR